MYVGAGVLVGAGLLVKMPQASTAGITSVHTASLERAADAQPVLFRSLRYPSYALTCLNRLV